MNPNRRRVNYVNTLTQTDWDLIAAIIPEGASVLDLGCGPGLYTSRLCVEDDGQQSTNWTDVAKQGEFAEQESAATTAPAPSAPLGRDHRHRTQQGMKQIHHHQVDRQPVRGTQQQVVP